MSIYDEVNGQLEDKRIDAEQVGAIGHYTGLNVYYVELVDGREIDVTARDYRVLEANLAAMAAEDTRRRLTGEGREVTSAALERDNAGSIPARRALVEEIKTIGGKGMKLTSEAIEAAYEALKAAVIAAFDAGEAAIAARTALEAMRLSMLMTGEIAGKNEAEREAKARQLLEEKYEGVDVCEALARREKTALELARLDVERVRAELRLMELVEAAA